MSKKRKTRSQKEKALQRREYQIGPQNVTRSEEIVPISYSVKDLKTKKPQVKILEKIHLSNNSQFKYLKNDMRKIAIATGLILSFDILLFALLSTNLINLGFLGY